MSNKGFASLTKEAKRLIGQKGGQKSQQSGAGHKLNVFTAKVAGLKGVMVRRRKLARAAALVLLEAGLTSEELHLLQLSEEEFIYYGGSKRTEAKLKELLGRLDDARQIKAAVRLDSSEVQ
tara:strand:+ start:512 stop:874 length:363 start_codon:yes stop_codon:yes gene_type:complete